MKTLINLEFPYSEDFVRGYLNVNKEPRRVVLLVRSDGTKTSTAYARYLMACSMGRYLSKEEQVDHIDNNRLNDVLSNLQILSKAENIRKSKQLDRPEYICPVCGVSFSPNRRQTGRPSPACSRRCGGIKSWKQKKA